MWVLWFWLNNVVILNLDASIDLQFHVVWLVLHDCGEWGDAYLVCDDSSLVCDVTGEHNLLLFNVDWLAVVVVLESFIVHA